MLSHFHSDMYVRFSLVNNQAEEQVIASGTICVEPKIMEAHLFKIYIFYVLLPEEYCFLYYFDI